MKILLDDFKKVLRNDFYDVEKVKQRSIFWNKCLYQQGFKPLNEEIYKATIQFIAEYSAKSRNKGLLFIGGQGTGKTTASIAICTALNEIMRTWGVYGLECHFFTVYGLISEYQKNNDGFVDYLEKKADCCIDDLGQEVKINDYGTKIELMKQVIEQRYNQFKFHNKKTIITTNLTTKEIEKRYGQHAISRINEMCVIVDATGKDLRIK